MWKQSATETRLPGEGCPNPRMKPAAGPGNKLRRRLLKEHARHPQQYKPGAGQAHAVLAGIWRRLRAADRGQEKLERGGGALAARAGRARAQGACEKRRMFGLKADHPAQPRSWHPQARPDPLHGAFAPCSRARTAGGTFGPAETEVAQRGRARTTCSTSARLPSTDHAGIASAGSLRIPTNKAWADGLADFPFHGLRERQQKSPASL